MEWDGTGGQWLQRSLRWGRLVREEVGATDGLGCQLRLEDATVPESLIVSLRRTLDRLGRIFSRLEERFALEFDLHLNPSFF